MFQHGLIQLLVGDSAPFVFSERMISLLQVLANLTSPPQKKHKNTGLFRGVFLSSWELKGYPRNSNPQTPPKKSSGLMKRFLPTKIPW